MTGNFSHYFNIDCVAEGFESNRLRRWKVRKVAHALETAAFPDRHVTLLPGDDGYLARGHCNKRGGCCRSFDPDARRTKLNYVSPDLTLLSFAVPFKFLIAGREFKNRGKPSVYPRLVTSVKIAVVMDELDLPFWEIPIWTTSVIR